MALGKETTNNTQYISFKPSIGSLVIKSDANDPEAKARTYKDSQSNEEKTVYEKRYKFISGKIVGIEVDTAGDYGSQLKVTLRDSKGDYTLPLPLNKSWGTKVAEQLPNIALDKDVVFSGYGDFTTDDGKIVKAGLSVKQNGERVPSAFNYQKDGVWVRDHGFPEYPKADQVPDQTKNKAKYTKFWNDYYFSVEEFLIEWFNKNLTIEYTPTQSSAQQSSADDITYVPEKTSDTSDDDIPF